MRKFVAMASGAVVAWAMMLGFAKNPTRHGAMEPQTEPRNASSSDLAWAAMTPDHAARACSFWTDFAGQCSIPAAYGPGSAPAQFLPLMRLSLRAPIIQPAVAARGSAWVAREQLVMTAANDADVAARYVTIEPGGATVVRVLRAGSFKPRRAAFADGGSFAKAA